MIKTLIGQNTIFCISTMWLQNENRNTFVALYQQKNNVLVVHHISKNINIINIIR